MDLVTQPVKQIVRKLVPVKARLRLHRLYETIAERTGELLGQSDPLLPPTRLMFVGGSRRDFRMLGQKWLGTFIRVGGLKASDDVLDVGCGVGRMAVALAGYLDPGAKYRGFDIVPEGIEWCQKAITPRHPRFEFQHADIYNEEYNPNGALRAADFGFPYADGAFDFVFLTSVFTHMLPDDVRHYMAEIRRVLRPGGRSLITWFVLDSEGRKRIEAGATSPLRRFCKDQVGYWVVDGQTPEAAVAYDEVDVRTAYADAGLTIKDPIIYGGWSGRPDSKSNHSQDIVFARR
ncbi:MAG: class I SAM-dependent methyltransferase [Gemmatimonadales bacterium]